MTYYFSRELEGSFELVKTKVIESFGKEGFSILVETDISAKLKEKLDVDFPKYEILGLCNPPFAHKALLTEIHIGAMLPCNVVLRELENKNIEVFAVDPISSMQAVDNAELTVIVTEIQGRMKRAIQEITYSTTEGKLNGAM